MDSKGNVPVIGAQPPEATPLNNHDRSGSFLTITIQRLVR